MHEAGLPGQPGRLAVNLGDQFGLSLYFSKGREVVTALNGGKIAHAKELMGQLQGLSDGVLAAIDRLRRDFLDHAKAA